MSKNAPMSRFVYVTYINTTPEKLWHALTDTEFGAQYWLGARPDAEWKRGGSWKLVMPDGSLADSGEIVEFDPPRQLAIKWLNERPELKAEGWSLCTMTVVPEGKVVKLTVAHTIDREESQLIKAVSGGWPQILSNLKSLLETGSTILAPKYAR